MRAEYRQNAMQLLRQGEWFGGLPEELQNLLVDNSMLRLVEANQVMVAEERPPTGLFVVLEGQVAITRQIGDITEYFFHLGGPGFWFGEGGLLNRQYSSMTATARTKIRALFLPISSFEKIVEAEPRYYRNIASLLVSRFGLLMRSLGQSSAFSPEEYLRIRLADLSDMIHLEGYLKDTVALALSQNDLAAMIGSSRQTINMLLKKFEAEGLIEVGFRKLTILDPVALRGDHRKTGL